MRVRSPTRANAARKHECPEWADAEIGAVARMLLDGESQTQIADELDLPLPEVARLAHRLQSYGAARVAELEAECAGVLRAALERKEAEPSEPDVRDMTEEYNAQRRDG